MPVAMSARVDHERVRADAASIIFNSQIAANGFG
jgi:hypothetical protein